MPDAPANGITLHYDTFGDPDGEPLLLVMGLGAHMISWDEVLCDALAARGHYVIRYDNRDVGLSTHLERAGLPDIGTALSQAIASEAVAAPYTLWDMADDAAGLLDHLGLDAAHVAGVSLGGMIGQCLALRYPQRVRSLTSIMSSTGERDLPPAHPDAAAILLTPAPRDRDGYVEHMVGIARILAGGRFPPEEARVRRRAAVVFERNLDGAGIARQLVAGLATAGRRDALATVDVPTVVIHGSDDPLIPLAHGEATAAAIPGAVLIVIEGMGHDLPTGAWGQLVEAITRNTAAARRAA